MAKVRANRTGFYLSLRYEGDEFEVPDNLAARPSSWFDVLEGPEPIEEAPAKPHPAAVRPAPKPGKSVPQTVAPATAGADGAI